MGQPQDILSKLGGQGGQDTGLANIQNLFGGGGTQGIVSQLTTAGMGQHVQSWISTGTNKSISGQQLQQAIDPAALQRLSQQTGMPTDQICDHVAQVLPQLIDKATPNGQMPANDPLTQGAGAIKSMFSR